MEQSIQHKKQREKEEIEFEKEFNEILKRQIEREEQLIKSKIVNSSVLLSIPCT